MGYGQHQSFYLRDRWLNKAIRFLREDPRFFYDKEAFEKIGLGKNMVQSLRYWAVATGVVEEVFNDDRKKIHLITEFGELFFRYDKFVKFQDTASILHFHMCREKDPSTAWFWVFNKFNETISTKENLTSEFIEWVKENENKPFSNNSLKKDIDCLIKLYTSGQSNIDPEEVIQSPLSKLVLLEEKKGFVYKRNLSASQIGLTALMYVLLEYKSKQNTDSVSVEELVNLPGLWGKVFNMTRAAIVNALTELSRKEKYSLSFIRTNNLDLIRIPNVSSLEFLKEEYSRKVEILHVY
ncbi:DUF4007 family protein [Neobacillus ginsengisoli]|uniref:DUF4007 domain-containing protein n=1 Tax=Neobacillus ginsengisoli TaxID=904295 RepID=A0ABT9XZQ9_9BACI|nr:DUF4007 family protein [Neobacillus ginsengisoli]MDQ0201065.1 hypothetical protein [Neobacillus ginsengisoli]